jgi:hypothetical protein
MIKYLISLFLILTTTAYPCQATDYKITGHYYVFNNAPASEPYKELIKWDINDLSGWSNFIKQLQGFPKLDNETGKNTESDEEIIQLSQVSPDQISGTDVYLSRSGIRQIDNLPTDIYYDSDNKALLKFIEGELKKHPWADSDINSNINILSRGIVVVYRGSDSLKNPTWLIKDPAELQTYKYQLADSLVAEADPRKFNRSEIGSTAFDDIGTYILYLNYENAPTQIVTIAKEGAIRGTTIEPKKYFFKDDAEMFKVFKKQALQTLKSGEEAKKTLKKDLSQEKF